MTKIRVGTFNVENLFARYNFKKGVSTDKAVKDGWLIDKTAFEIFSREEKKITAEAIRAMNADVVAFQEVESLDVLRRFRTDPLKKSKEYPHMVLIDGPDPRRIDIAILSKLPIVHVRSYQHLKLGSAPLFSRDCLEADIEVSPGRSVTLFVQHFKSMLDKDHPCEGRKVTRAKREAQAAKVMEIVTDRFGSKAEKERFVILGDFNDYLDKDTQGAPGIAELVNWNKVENVVGRLPNTEQWTHYWSGNKQCQLPEAYRQLDYLLLSKALAGANSTKPEIVRKGLPKRAKRYTGPRFAGVGASSPKASDHCPVVMEIEV